jgi:hypothetical protein
MNPFLKQSSRALQVNAGCSFSEVDYNKTPQSGARRWANDERRQFEKQTVSLRTLRLA